MLQGWGGCAAVVLLLWCALRLQFTRAIRRWRIDHRAHPRPSSPRDGAEGGGVSRTHPRLAWYDPMLREWQAHHSLQTAERELHTLVAQPLERYVLVFLFFTPPAVLLAANFCGDREAAAGGSGPTLCSVWCEFALSVRSLVTVAMFLGSPDRRSEVGHLPRLAWKLWARLRRWWRGGEVYVPINGPPDDEGGAAVAEELSDGQHPPPLSFRFVFLHPPPLASSLPCFLGSRFNLAPRRSVARLAFVPCARTPDGVLTFVSCNGGTLNFCCFLSAHRGLCCAVAGRRHLWKLDEGAVSLEHFLGEGAYGGVWAGWLYRSTPVSVKVGLFSSSLPVVLLGFSPCRQCTLPARLIVHVLHFSFRCSLLSVHWQSLGAWM